MIQTSDNNDNKLKMFALPLQSSTNHLFPTNMHQDQIVQNKQSDLRSMYSNSEISYLHKQFLNTQYQFLLYIIYSVLTFMVYENKLCLWNTNAPEKAVFWKLRP